MTKPTYMIAHGSAAVQAARIIAANAKERDNPTANEKIARARRALERIRNVGRDRSEKAGWRIDDMIDEAEEAMRFLALPTKI
ncbi:hypothetical protein [Agrobacterium pusense]|uniref:hypothetical protein n=1 Tax=Agrobacterium pusense TaxID=648995 RepID=UPI000512FBDE|nr:hypothetical protein [Agrobacterium pusense]ANV24484.1 hypothetical protein BA939_11420 [Rhizobium sp. S41]KGE81482.1 hypothetical protein LW14_17725 [Rhizobium sp. H41]QWW74145.1 hypothetical protein KP800_01140 [Agrobacterium pusense]